MNQQSLTTRYKGIVSNEEIAEICEEARKGSDLPIEDFDRLVYDKVCEKSNKMVQHVRRMARDHKELARIKLGLNLETINKIEND